jgi:hypothetical protein
MHFYYFQPVVYGQYRRPLAFDDCFKIENCPGYEFFGELLSSFFDCHRRQGHNNFYVE